MELADILELLRQSSLVGAGEAAAGAAGDKLEKLGEVGHDATAIADENFPGQSWDFSQKNAFRHALGTGMLTQELGGGEGGAALAKLIGYLWEARGLPDGGMSWDERMTDTGHDLNANAIGAAEASTTDDRAALIEALLKHSLAAKKSAPVGFTERTPGHFTYGQNEDVN